MLFEVLSVFAFENSFELRLIMYSPPQVRVQKQYTISPTGHAVWWWRGRAQVQGGGMGQATHQPQPDQGVKKNCLVICLCIYAFDFLVTCILSLFKLPSRTWP